MHVRHGHNPMVRQHGSQSNTLWHRKHNWMLLAGGSKHYHQQDITPVRDTSHVCNSCGANHCSILTVAFVPKQTDRVILQVGWTPPPLSQGRPATQSIESQLLTVAFVPRLTDGGTTLSYLLGVKPVSCRAVSAAATCRYSPRQQMQTY